MLKIDVFCFMRKELTTMICVVVLQDCMDFVEGENGSCSETCVMFEEVNIKVEEDIGIEDEIPEPTVFIPIKIEHEVRLCGVVEAVAAHAFRPFIAPTKTL
jgi:hypothetical protein